MGDAIRSEAAFASQFGLPGWETRLIPMAGLEDVFFLEPHDMAVVKLFAGRPKAIALLTDLLKAGRRPSPTVFRRLMDTPVMPESKILKTH